ncbi:CBO0543 family protein [Parageobacillus sp. G301]|uniref:CBO0543 family protein n=1 Tax=Parageobacillus sp. G301 TaxID=2998290 RepID=UPI002556B42C|nr:CBO0543 family protein [Parageobacillus sp. G301]
MNIVKHSKKSNLRSSRKKLFSIQSKQHISAYISTALFASWIGTYLDLYFTGKQWYIFLEIPYPDIFTINILFTLIILPILTTLFLYLMEKMQAWKKVVFIVTASLVMALGENLAEAIGWFTHSNQWEHIYSFFGYLLFMIIVWKFYRWMSSI